MDTKIRTLSNSSSSSRNTRPRGSSTSTASSSTTSSSSTSSTSSSDSETSTFQGSSVKSITVAVGSADLDVANPPNKKARVLRINANIGLGLDKSQYVEPLKKQRIPNPRSPVSEMMKDNEPINTTRPRPSHSKCETVTKLKEMSASATQFKCESNETAVAAHPRFMYVANIGKKSKKSNAGNFSEAESLSDCDGGNHMHGSVVKHTRSYSDIKSKYLAYSEESESDTRHNVHSSKVKKNSWEEPSFSEVLIREQRCPLRDCDSLGHLGGHLAKHFTKEACPMYHNQTVQECEAAYLKRQRNTEGMQTATTNVVSKPKAQQINKEHRDNVTKELRIVLQDYLNLDHINIIEGSEAMRVNREPKLAGVAPEHDVHMFREAQAIASENVEQDQNMPYAMGTKLIELGKYNLQVWYQSPYPEDFGHAPKLYICEFCLHYMKSSTTNRRHTLKCVWRHPPGEEIYRHNKISIWEVDGKKYREYCQNLCLLAKFFLDHKTLHDNVEPFFFYVMTKQDSSGCHAVGYFSKEKNSTMNYNVSCILTFPHYQRQGYGRLLIDFSYLLTRIEGKIGTPEKPLSDLGLISYRSYWKDVLLNYLHTFTGKELSIKDISQETGINSYDIVSTLQALSMIKYWKGKHIILKKQELIDEYLQRFKKQETKNKHIDSLFLKWVPNTSR